MISTIMPRRAMHRVRNRGEIEVIVAPRCHRGTDEDRVDEQCGGDLLQPEPGMADGAGDDVEHDRQREPEAQQPAQHHQPDFELVESGPLQMMLALQQQADRRWTRQGVSFAELYVIPGRGRPLADANPEPRYDSSARDSGFARTKGCARPGMTAFSRSPGSSVLILSAWGPSSFASLSR